MPQYVPCSQCGKDVTEDSDFCPHCGVLFETDSFIACESHQDIKASSVCVICQVLLCLECEEIRNGRRFCADHRNVDVEQDWAKVFESTEINDAELVKSVLESAGIGTLARNFESIGFAWDGGGDSPQSRSNLSKPAKVFVPIPEYMNAQTALREWEAGESDTPA